MTIYPGSVGGTPAARMIHAESEQLLIGHYLIDKKRKYPHYSYPDYARTHNGNSQTSGRPSQ